MQKASEIKSNRQCNIARRTANAYSFCLDFAFSVVLPNVRTCHADTYGWDKKYFIVTQSISNNHTTQTPATP